MLLCTKALDTYYKPTYWVRLRYQTNLYVLIVHWTSQKADINSHFLVLFLWCTDIILPIEVRQMNWYVRFLTDTVGGSHCVTPVIVWNMSFHKTSARGQESQSCVLQWTNTVCITRHLYIHCSQMVKYVEIPIIRETKYSGAQCFYTVFYMLEFTWIFIS